MFKRWFVFFFPILLVGCTTYYGLKPIAPRIYEETTNPRPLFQWQSSEKLDVRYDFIVYERVMKGSVPIPGETVYYRENLESPEHQIETDLTPGKRYLWAVRIREGENVGPWSLYDFTAYLVFTYIMQRNLLYQLYIVDPNVKKPVSPLGAQ